MFGKSKKEVDKKGNNYKDDSRQDTHVHLVIGKPRQGKSTIVEQEIVQTYVKKQDKHFRDGKYKVKRRVLIYDPSGSNAFSHHQRITFDELRDGVRHPTTGKLCPWEAGVRRIGKLPNKQVPEFFVWVTTNFRNGMFIVDDAAEAIKRSGDAPTWLKACFRNFGNYSVYPVFIFHQFVDVHKDLRALPYIFTLFRVPDHPTGPKWFSDLRFPMPKKLYESWIKVETAEHNGNARIQAHIHVTQNNRPRVKLVNVKDIKEDAPKKKARRSTRKRKSKTT